MNIEKVRVLLEAALREQMDAGCPGAILEVGAPGLDTNISLAQGLFDKNRPQPLHSGDAFRAASVTKAITATTAVYLAANQHWNLDDSIGDYLPTEVVDKLKTLNGLDNVNQLTIRRLLTHTSGLPDYFFDDQFQAQVRKEPDRIWQAQELIQAATEVGQLLFSPGTGFSYGDTAYVVVGIAIERLLNCSLAEAYRSIIFEPLRMETTFLEWHETPREHNLSHHYDEEHDLWEANLSYDWAGGGLVTTASDLTLFLRGLFGETVFERRWINELMDWQIATRWRPHSSARYIYYGMGLGTDIAFGEEIVGATGVWGAFAYYWPAGDATITGTLNLVGADRPALMDAVISALKQH